MGSAGLQHQSPWGAEGVTSEAGWLVIHEQVEEALLGGCRGRERKRPGPDAPPPAHLQMEGERRQEGDRDFSPRWEGGKQAHLPRGPGRRGRG